VRVPWCLEEALQPTRIVIPAKAGTQFLALRNYSTAIIEYSAFWEVDFNRPPKVYDSISFFTASLRVSLRPHVGIDTVYVLTYAIRQQENAVVTPITASEARADLYRLIDQTSESHQPILISGKRSSAVLVSAEDWQAIQETLYLLSVPGMRESIKKGMTEPLGKSAKAVVW
jgi:antitoxin YefM